MVVSFLCLGQKVVGFVPGLAAERQVIERGGGGVDVLQRVDFAGQGGAGRTEHQECGQKYCCDLHLTLHGPDRSVSTRNASPCVIWGAIRERPWRHLRYGTRLWAAKYMDRN